MDKSNDQPRGWGAWVLDHSLALVTILGVVLYGAIRLSYATYYGRLGLTPEEVGLGYAEILARSAMGVIVLTVIFVLILLTYAVLGGVAMALFRNFQALVRDFSSPPSSRQLVSNIILAVRRILRRLLNSRFAAVTSAAAAVLILFVLLPWSASSAASDLRSGRGRDALSLGPFVVLDLRSAPATVLSASDVSEEISDRCLVYLGQSDGVVSLFDVDRSAVVKMAQADAIVEIATPSGDHFSVDC